LRPIAATTHITVLGMTLSPFQGINSSYDIYGTANVTGSATPANEESNYVNGTEKRHFRL
jgi:hypothetical protein